MSSINPPTRTPPPGAQGPWWHQFLTDVYLIFERIRRINLGSVSMSSGTGTPESNVVGSVGDLYLRTDGSTSTTLYVKTSGTGNTGWTAK